MWIANKGEAWIEINEPPPNTVLISITEPGRKARTPKGYLDILRLEFQDYDPSPLPDPTSGLHGTAFRKIPDDAVLFTPTQAAGIVRFARKHRENGSNILVHCAAGISRSGAVAEALLQAFPDYEDAGWPRHPNGHVRSLMKRALGLVPLGAGDG